MASVETIAPAAPGPAPEPQATATLATAEPTAGKLEPVQDPPPASAPAAKLPPAELKAETADPQFAKAAADDTAAQSNSEVAAPRALSQASAPPQLGHAPRVLNVTAMTRLPEPPDAATTLDAPRRHALHTTTRLAAPFTGRAEVRPRPAVRPVTAMQPLPSWLTAERPAPPTIRKARIMSAPFHTLSLPPQVTAPPLTPAAPVTSTPALRRDEASESAAPQVASREDGDEPAPRPAVQAYPRPRWYSGPAYRPYQPYGYGGYGYPPPYGAAPYGNPYGGYYGGRPGYYPPQPPNDVTMD